MTNKIKEVLDRAQAWPAEDQAELAEFAELIESRRRDGYSATPEELQAIDDADRSGVASKQEVEAAFRAFRRA